ncbi:cryptochrome/photolyase family protein, partial [Methylogaea oryzae]|uniref:cryptochrome/photolyase family protein n=1 Tax=Methylogaea oryzae TaxID=1295382 RepID=UPI000A7460FE
SEPLAALALLPRIAWDREFYDCWTPGEQGAIAALRCFIDTALAHYAVGRDMPAQPVTSRLSPHLHFGEIGPRQIVHALLDEGDRAGATAGLDKFLDELGWREFAHYLLYHFPRTVTEPLDQRFADMAWESDAEGLRAWQRGLTGFPLVDAGMRQLWRTGWMHNRVRMIAASLLAKNLLLPWQEGARWFWDTLVDADLANNGLGWQWVAGCGADAAPYFRVFNPVLQGEKFDPQGDYVRQWVPALARMPARWIHQPGRRRQTSWRRPACGWERPIRCPSSTWPIAAGGRCLLSTPSSGANPQ